MIPKEFKETEVRVYNKKSKKHSEKIAKYVTKQRNLMLSPMWCVFQLSFNF